MAWKDKEKQRVYNQEYNRTLSVGQRECKRKYQKEHAEQHRESDRKYRVAHVEELRKKNRQWKDVLRDFVREQRTGKLCILCGKGDVNKLVFHHRDPSTKLFAIGRTAVRSKQAIREEIAKCDVLCQSCHVSLHNKLR